MGPNLVSPALRHVHFWSGLHFGSLKKPSSRKSCAGPTSPARSAAKAVKILKVDPGGYKPVIVRLVSGEPAAGSA